jgi:5-formyltetrahydrofolate cyclo-ligase
MKSSLRLDALRKRNNLNSEFVQEQSLLISEKIKALPEFITATSIALYYPKGNEVDIRSVCGFDCEKKYYFPKHHPIEYKLVEAMSLKDFELGAFNVLEPKSSIEIDPENIDLWLVPGVAFSVSGDRIGYGKGIYDQLMKKSNAPKVGICFKSQLFKTSYDSEPWDIKMDKIITE